MYDKLTPMHKTFTKDDLLLYLYDEMSQKEQQELRMVISADDRFKINFQTLKEVKEYLDNVRVGPSKLSVSNIVSYAKALTVKPSKQLRTVDFVLN